MTTNSTDTTTMWTGEVAPISELANYCGAAFLEAPTNSGPDFEASDSDA